MFESVVFTENNSQHNFCNEELLWIINFVMKNCYEL